MKRILLICFYTSLIFLVGCGSKNEETTSTMLQNKEIQSFTIQFKKDTVEITETTNVETIKLLLADCTLEKNSSLKEVKGWIYRVTAKGDYNKEIYQIWILDEKTIRYEDDIYTCSNMSLSKLDEISGIDRYN